MAVDRQRSGFSIVTEFHQDFPLPDTFLTSRPEVICSSMWTIFPDHVSDTNYCLVSLSSRQVSCTGHIARESAPLHPLQTDQCYSMVSLSRPCVYHVGFPCKNCSCYPIYSIWFHIPGHAFSKMSIPVMIAAAYILKLLHGSTPEVMSLLRLQSCQSLTWKFPSGPGLSQALQLGAL